MTSPATALARSTPANSLRNSSISGNWHWVLISRSMRRRSGLSCANAPPNTVTPGSAGSPSKFFAISPPVPLTTASAGERSGSDIGGCAKRGRRKQPRVRDDLLSLSHQERRLGGGGRRGAAGRMDAGGVAHRNRTSRFAPDFSSSSCRSWPFRGHSWREKLNA